MHADEFIISPSRQLEVCNKTIQKIKKSLGILERKHGKTTDQFIEELESGMLPASADLKDDYDAWKSSYESLKRWEELKKQYQEAYKTRKI
jgi:predicted RNase H-like nuclease (RuvC/YqgF family)